MQRDAGIPSVAVYVVEAVMIIMVLLSESVSRRGFSISAAEAEPA
jgi:ABC-type uncharacterized transport system permease subunit